jgi:glutaminase
MAMEHVGEQVVHQFVGRGSLFITSFYSLCCCYHCEWYWHVMCHDVEPSGRAFNELSLNHEMIPHNPLINRYAALIQLLFIIVRLVMV